MHKSMKGILGVVSGVALAIGTASAAPATKLESSGSTATTESAATAGKAVPEGKVKAKKGIKTGKPSKVKKNTGFEGQGRRQGGAANQQHDGRPARNKDQGRGQSGAANQQPAVRPVAAGRDYRLSDECPHLGSVCNSNRTEPVSGTLMIVALVSMPWGDFGTPSAALGALSGYIRQNLPNIEITCHSEHLEFSERIGSKVYEALGNNRVLGESLYLSTLFPERREAV